MNRRIIREHVFKMLFQEPFYNREEFPGQWEYYLEDIEGSAKEKTYLTARALNVLNLCGDIDQEVDRVSEHWRIGRIGKTDLAIFRLAVYEISYDDAVPVGAAINEAVELAKRYGSDDHSYSFINGILSKYVQIKGLNTETASELDEEEDEKEL